MKCISLVILITFTLFGAMALAGQATPAPVEVDTAARGALGDQWTARTDPDGDVYIGCGVRFIDDGAGGVFTFGFCQAEDSAGDTILCSTENPALIEAIQGISDFSFITFGWDADLVCTRIGYSTQSFYLPEFKTK